MSESQPPAAPRKAVPSAEDYARRYHRQNHFMNQEYAERAYFRVLAEWLQRGRVIDSIQRKLHAGRKRAQKYRAALATERQQHAKEKRELELSIRMLRDLQESRSPFCEHESRYLFTEDGGKHIICTRCELTAARQGDPTNETTCRDADY